MSLFNLPAMMGDWACEQVQAPTIPGQWFQILPFDPTRWSVGFSAGLGGSVLVSTVADATGVAGILIGSSLTSIFYKDYGPLVQAEWLAFDLVGRGAIDVFTACMRLLPGVAPSADAARPQPEDPAVVYGRY